MQWRIKEAIKIQKRASRTVNRDEGAFLLSHTQETALKKVDHRWHFQDSTTNGKTAPNQCKTVIKTLVTTLRKTTGSEQSRLSGQKNLLDSVIANYTVFFVFIWHVNLMFHPIIARVLKKFSSNSVQKRCIILLYKYSCPNET